MSNPTRKFVRNRVTGSPEVDTLSVICQLVESGVNVYIGRSKNSRLLDIHAECEPEDSKGNVFAYVNGEDWGKVMDLAYPNRHVEHAKRVAEGIEQEKRNEEYRAAQEVLRVALERQDWNAIADHPLVTFHHATQPTDETRDLNDLRELHIHGSIWMSVRRNGKYPGLFNVMQGVIG